jgi:hypothetical protein
VRVKALNDSVSHTWLVASLLPHPPSRDQGSCGARPRGGLESMLLNPPHLVAYRPPALLMQCSRTPHRVTHASTAALDHRPSWVQVQWEGWAATEVTEFEVTPPGSVSLVRGRGGGWGAQIVDLGEGHTYWQASAEGGGCCDDAGLMCRMRVCIVGRVCGSRGLMRFIIPW